MSEKHPKYPGYTGVYAIEGSERFEARIRHNGKLIYLGTFDLALEGHYAYEAAKKAIEANPGKDDDIIKELVLSAAAASWRRPVSFPHKA